MTDVFPRATPAKMPFSQETVDGFLLAALLADDSAPADWAGVAAHGLADIRKRHGDLSALTTQARSAALASSMGAPSVIAAEGESPRVRAMVSTLAPKDVGRRWLADAPPMRRGYAPERGLRDVVARQVSVGASTESRAAKECAELTQSIASDAADGAHP